MSSNDQLRFGVFDGQSKRAATWKLFWRRSDRGPEIYLTNRNVGGNFKTSFHVSGKCHTGFDYNFYHSDAERFGLKSRFADEWDFPAELKDGVTIFYQIHTLPEAIRVESSGDQKKSFVEIPAPQQADHIRVTQFFMVADGSKFAIRGCNLIEVGELNLGDGRTIRICSFEEPRPKYPEKTGEVNLMGQSKADDRSKLLGRSVNAGGITYPYGIAVRTTVESVVLETESKPSQKRHIS